MDLRLANARLEQAQWDLFWLPANAEVIDRPELLVLHCREQVSYLNAVMRTRAAPARLPALIDEVAAVHAHTTSKWLVADTIYTLPLEEALGSASYAPRAHHEARVVATADFVACAQSTTTVRLVADMVRLRECMAVADEAFGRTTPHSDEALAVELANCIGAAARVHRFVGYDERDKPICSGGLSSYPALGIGFMWAGGTVPSARGRGAYSALVAARVAHAAALGLDGVGLYAKSDTSAPLVARQGFLRCGEMCFWERPPTAC